METKSTIRITRSASKWKKHRELCHGVLLPLKWAHSLILIEVELRIEILTAARIRFLDTLDLIVDSIFRWLFCLSNLESEQLKGVTTENPI